MKSRDPIRVTRRIVLLQDILYQRDIMHAPIGTDQSQTTLDRIRSPDRELSQRGIQAGIDEAVGRPLCHGFVMTAQVVSMRVIVRPLADGVVVERVQERGLVLRQHGRELDHILSLGVRCVSRVPIDATVKAIPVANTGRGAGYER